MAKINRRIAEGRQTHKVGRTLFAEKSLTFDGVETIYYEAFRVRSDGDVQRRLIRTLDPVTREVITEHRGGAFRSFGKIKHGPNISEAFLEQWLEGKGFTIVKKEW